MNPNTPAITNSQFTDIPLLSAAEIVQGSMTPANPAEIQQTLAAQALIWVGKDSQLSRYTTLKQTDITSRKRKKTTVFNPEFLATTGTMSKQAKTMDRPIKKQLLFFRSMVLSTICVIRHATRQEIPETMLSRKRSPQLFCMKEGAQKMQFEIKFPNMIGTAIVLKDLYLHISIAVKKCSFDSQWYSYFRTDISPQSRDGDSTPFISAILFRASTISSLVSPDSRSIGVFSINLIMMAIIMIRWTRQSQKQAVFQCLNPQNAKLLSIIPIAQDTVIPLTNKILYSSATTSLLQQQVY